MAHWLFKTEPSSFSIADLARAPQQATCWDGVRNYQARNMLRDQMKVGDGVLLYHSSCDVPGIVGTAEIVREGYPDPTAFDPAHHHFDPKSKPEAPAWYMVDVKLVETFADPVTLDALKGHPVLSGMVAARQGNRLSVTPVTDAEWQAVLALGGATRRAPGLAH